MSPSFRHEYAHVPLDNRWPVALWPTPTTAEHPRKIFNNRQLDSEWQSINLLHGTKVPRYTSIKHSVTRFYSQNATQKSKLTESETSLTAHGKSTNANFRVTWRDIYGRAGNSNALSATFQTSGSSAQVAAPFCRIKMAAVSLGRRVLLKQVTDVFTANSRVSCQVQQRRCQWNLLKLPKPGVNGKRDRKSVV